MRTWHKVLPMKYAHENMGIYNGAWSSQWIGIGNPTMATMSAADRSEHPGEWLSML